jgi:CDP-diacylglycerol--serine O-phosphatidyltransferase
VTDIKQRLRVSERLKKPGLRRGAAILPSLFTIGNLFIGFLAIVRAVNNDLNGAAPLIVLAIVLDILDGRIARLTGTTSEFGAQLDSLSDLVSFGVAPALLAYQWGLSSLPRGFLAAFFFVMCAALRLARFNVQKKATDSRYFVGLPSPAAAGQIAAIVYFWPDPLTTRSGGMFTAALLVLVAFLMVSTLKYWSFKTIDLKSRRSHFQMVGVGGLLVLVSIEPSWAFLGWACFYTLSGIFLYLVPSLRRAVNTPAPEPAPVASVQP